jgi:hypothetical protein
LPDVPDTITCCRDWAKYHASKKGDMLTEEQANSMALLPVFCALDMAIQRGLQELPKEALGEHP